MKSSDQILYLTKIKAALFDMDGTMVDNQPYHRKAWLEFSKRHNLNLTDEEVLQKTSGKKNAQILPEFMGANITQEEMGMYADEKEEIYRDLYRPHVTPIKGLIEFVKSLKANGLKLAVATTAQKKNREFILKALGILPDFDVIVGEEDFTHGKPNPEIFLKAAEKLYVAPETCVVFDDAPVGIQAAKAANMKFVGLVTTHKREEFTGADILVNDFTDLKLQV